MILSTQMLIFLKACMLGCFICIVYDCFRIIRILFTNPAWLVFIEDIIFIILATVSSFVFIVTQNNGQFRFFLLVGELIGGIIYFYTISKVIIKIATVIIQIVHKILRFILKIASIPVMFFYKILKKIFTYIKMLVNKINFRIYLLLKFKK